MASSALSPFGHTMVTTFGLGHFRPASGTWGSLPSVLLAGGLIALGVGPHVSPIIYHAVLALCLLVFCLACLVWGDRAEARFHKKDPGQVVADETAGQCLPLMFLPALSTATFGDALFSLALAFFVFRALDILKLWPADRLQQLPSGWGILIDDLVAGLQALIVVQIVLRVMYG